MNVYLYSCLSYPACQLFHFSTVNYIFICDLFVCTVFPTLCRKWHDLRKKISDITVWLDLLYKFCLKWF